MVLPAALAHLDKNQRAIGVADDQIYFAAASPRRPIIALHQLRITACKFGIQKLDVSNATLNLLFIDKPPVEPLQIVLLMQQLKTCKYDGKNKLIWQVKSVNLAAKRYNAEFILNLPFISRK